MDTRLGQQDRCTYLCTFASESFLEILEQVVADFRHLVVAIKVVISDLIC